VTGDQLLRARIRDVPDFPKPGIVFRDITPLLGDAKALAEACARLSAPFRDKRVERVVGIESRGFMFGPPVALALRAGFVPARKLGRLPWETVRRSYALEYGSEHLEMHRDAIRAGERVLIVDDVLATGGTAQAAVQLVQSLGASVIGASFLLELGFLEGRKLLDGIAVHAVLEYA
jgi:adenine phosphoribosyltransferase